ncbi:MAG: L-histidine N(alpha)-methyltransferase [archaeon]
MFTKRQESELITAIKGRGEIPLKFVYLGKGANLWDEIAKFRAKKNKGINQMETDLLQKRVNNILSSYSNLKKINIIDIGCGNGYPTVPVLDALYKNKIPFRYVAVDISKEMLDIAEKNLKQKYKNIEIKKYQIDFESGNFSDITYELKQDGSSNLLFFLGNTVGNQSDIGRVLSNFRDSMTSEDYLIVGVELTNTARVNKIIPHYDKKILGEILCRIPKSIGINDNNSEYFVIWNDKLSQIEVRLKLKKDITVQIGDYKFILEKDEQILICRSAKFSDWHFNKIFSDVGFRTELLTTNKDSSYILNMVQPTRYNY